MVCKACMPQGLHTVVKPVVAKISGKINKIILWAMQLSYMTAMADGEKYQAGVFAPLWQSTC